MTAENQVAGQHFLVAPESPATKEALNRLSTVRSRMLLASGLMFFGHLALYLDMVVTNDPLRQTAWTDGQTIWFDQTFIRGLDDDELMFLIAHETLHVALRHTRRAGLEARLAGADREIANFAADFVVNGILAQAGLKIIAGALHDSRFDGLAFEVVYQILTQELFTTCVARQIDSHDHWGVCEGDEVTGDELWRGRLSSARAASPRDLSYALSVHLERILYPCLPWRELLRQCAEVATPGNYSWHPGNRRHIWRGLHLPTMAPVPTLDAAIYIDISGSIDKKVDVPEFLGGVEEMVTAFPLWHLSISQFDTEIVDTLEFSTGDELKLTGWIKSGGGTSFQPLVDHALREGRMPHHVIVFTDGYAEMPTCPEPINLIWVVLDSGRPNDAFTIGQVIRLPRRWSFTQ